jgi:hypothetical protein
MAIIRVQGKFLSRRSLLRGVLGGAIVSIGLPPLEYFFNQSGNAYACGGVIPKRFGIFYWGNGMRPERWVCTGDGTEWELSEELASLINVKSRLTVVSGMAVKLPNLVPHTSGAGGLLSGAPITDDQASFTAPSIDQLIAAEIGSDTLYRSLQTTATGASGHSWNGPYSQNPPENDPYSFFERIFGSGFHLPGDSAAIDPTLALRQSVLDAVLEDANRLKNQVGANDKIRLDAHLEGIRELEQRLAKLQEDPPQLDACGVTEAPLTEYPDEDGRPQISARSRAMCDLLVMAMACDQTRVIGHYLNDQVADTLFPGASAGHHDLTHNESGDQPEVHSITTQIIEEYAYLLEKMQAVQEGEETLLDNACILGCSEVSLGQTHSLEDLPILLGGSACGKLKTDIHYRSYTSENASKVCLSLIRAFDIVQASFGVDEAYVTDGLSSIEV